MVEFVSALVEEAAQHIDGYEGAEIADVPVVVNRRPAGIHANRVVPGRQKFFDLAGERVVEVEGQEAILANKPLALSHSPLAKGMYVTTATRT
jgi:hypothetical protein